MSLFRVIKNSLLVFAFILTSPPLVFSASADFLATREDTITIDPNNFSLVNQAYSLTNLTAAAYPTSFAIDLGSSNASNIEAFLPNGQKIPFVHEKVDNLNQIILTFPEKNVGKGKTLNFVLNYKNHGLLQKKGSVLELNIPPNKQNIIFETYKLTVMVPIDYNQPVSASPEPSFIQTDPAYIKLIYSDQEAIKNGIVAAFGDKQTYELNLTYNLANNTITPIETQIALPPDTANQRVHIRQLNPKPLNIHQDPDGNWIALYKLDSKAVIKVNYSSDITVYSQALPAKNSKEIDFSKYIESSIYWQTQDLQVKQLAEKLKTPENILIFLIDTLSFKSDLNKTEKIQRRGAVKTLLQPESSSSVDYADCFVTIARAAGIPSRLITGYGYSVASPLFPTEGNFSFHAWAEYYDPVTKIWQPVDPAWADTSGVSDFVHNYGFNHLVFTINGQDAERPYAPETYIDLNFTAENSLSLTDRFPQKEVSFISHISQPLLFSAGLTNTVNFSLTNSGNTAYYNLPLDFGISNRTLTSNPNPLIPSLLPYETIFIPLQFKSALNWQPTIVTATVYGQIQSHTLKYYPIIFIGAICFTLLGLAVIIFKYTSKTRSILVHRLK